MTSIFKPKRFEVGDIVTRDGSDRQKIIEIDEGYECITVECVKAPDTNWCKIGETELNLARRYGYPDELQIDVASKYLPKKKKGISNMKDFTKDQLQFESSSAGTPDVEADQAIKFCLEQLYADKVKTVEDIVAGSCTYEELISALLLAKQEIEDLKSVNDALQEHM